MHKLIRSRDRKAVKNRGESCLQFREMKVMKTSGYNRIWRQIRVRTLRIGCWPGNLSSCWPR